MSVKQTGVCVRDFHDSGVGKDKAVTCHDVRGQVLSMQHPAEHSRQEDAVGGYSDVLARIVHEFIDREIDALDECREHFAVGIVEGRIMKVCTHFRKRSCGDGVLGRKPVEVARVQAFVQVLGFDDLHWRPLVRSKVGDGIRGHSRTRHAAGINDVEWILLSMFENAVAKTFGLALAERSKRLVPALNDIIDVRGGLSVADKVQGFILH